MQTAQDPPPADDIPTAPLPDYATQPDAAPETLVVGQLMGTFEAVYSAEDNANYLRDVRESLDLFTNEGIVHPGLILRMANRALSMNVRLGPWIHVGSENQNYGAARVASKRVTRPVARGFRSSSRRHRTGRGIWVHGRRPSDRPGIRAPAP